MAERAVAVEEIVVRRGRVSVPLPGKIARTTPMVESDLVLTETKLVYEVGQAGKKQETREIFLEDLIGVHVIQKPPANNSLACQVEIHSYPLSKKSRKFATAEVQFNSAPTFRDNLYMAVDWKKAINGQCQQAVRKEFCFADENSTAAVSEGEAVAVPRHLLVFINPVGGPGKGVSEFKQHVQPMFDMAEINYNVIVTERQGHAHDVIKDYDVSKIDGIVMASGDGLLYEVMNGLMEREDWEQAIKTPIGMLPMGSGNGLCASTLYESGEEFSLTNAVFQIIRGGIIPMDVGTVHTVDSGKCYMGLLSCWGFVADVDIESEKWRRIGGARFVLGALSAIVKKRVYQGRLHYLPYDENLADHPTSDEAEEPTHQPSQNGSNHHQAERDMADSGAVGSEVNGADISQTELGHTAVGGERRQTSPINIDTLQPLRNADSSLYPHSYEQAVSESSRISPNLLLAATNGSGCETQGDRKGQDRRKEAAPAKSEAAGPQTDLLPALSEPVPGNWKTIEGDFNSVNIVMTSHVANGIRGHPDMTIGTGKFSVNYATGNMSRMGMLSMLTNADTGGQVNLENFYSVNAKAFRIEPITTPGLVTVDGEVVPFGPIQSQVHAHLGRVMCRKRRPRPNK